MKRTALFTLCALFLLLIPTSCKVGPFRPSSEDFKAVEHVGTVPAEFENIISNNLFYGVEAFSDRLLVSNCVSTDYDAHTAEYEIEMMDLYGNRLASCTYKTRDAHRIGTLTATQDGGFLFVSAFVDQSYGQDVWASDSGVASHVVKCDEDGTIEWDISFDDYEDNALKVCIERNNRYYFFGDNQVPETKLRGTYSFTDVYMTVLSEDGELILEKRLSGSDFDSLNYAEIVDGKFLLSISSQSDDGDFAGPDSGRHGVGWVFCLDDDLNVVKKKIAEGREALDDRIGEKNAVPIFESDQLFKDFDAGIPEVFIDYGDFYLVVSTNTTGVYENTPPFVSAMWYYTETVYSAYSQDGQLIFRSSVDSSPDYDSWIKGLAGDDKEWNSSTD